MSEKAILITGAAGEVGHALVAHFAKKGGCRVVALDLAAEPGYSYPHVHYIKADIRDKAIFESIDSKFDVTEIFHLAAVLSTGGEKNPLLAHEVNVEGGLNVLNLARSQGIKRGSATKVIFPSTIAVYGISDLATKAKAGKVKETDYLTPITMYGVNKLYVENLGRYYERYFQYLTRAENEATVDFRGVRFPGLLSSETIPTGGTSDYGPEMLHSAAQGKNYECFVEAGTTIPFMVMPDAVRVLLELANAPKAKLTLPVYNVTAFAPSAEQIHTEILKHFPDFKVTYKPHPKRLAICNSWPSDTDDSKARADWGWKADYDFSKAFSEYLVPAVTQRYSAKKKAVGF